MISKNIQRAMLKANHIGAESKVFTYLAECLRQEGIVKNIWHLPSGDSFYFSQAGSLVNPGNPLIGRVGPCPDFDQIALIKNIRANQAGKISFPEFLVSLWKAGVIRYEIDFTTRQMSYFGAFDQVYQENYPTVEIETSSTESFLP
ncbi:DUF1398 family protein [Lactococcus sp. DD01]|uniref:DUF1398 family protein n=1 Tax=Lactococcus sp. DD01 TaxID=1776443 RepID=UPI0007760434|nr:DUF1398 family protein [Lactococcus sp. DD01]KXT62840.1 Phage envelope protein [Lactococcus sp. DD01]